MDLRSTSGISTLLKGTLERVTKNQAFHKASERLLEALRYLVIKNLLTVFCDLDQMVFEGIRQRRFPLFLQSIMFLKSLPRRGTFSPRETRIF